MFVSNRKTVPLLLACWAVAAVQGRAADEIDFNRDIRPILSDRCYFCHGPDEANREAGLRLDDREEAAYVLETEELLDRIDSDDPDMQMPPPDSNLDLSAEQKALLRRWINEGAPYATHWSFEKLPTEVKVPEVNHETWSRQTLDRFVLAKIEDAGAKPNAEADPLRWYRRVTLDLTGLPPTIEAIEKFETAVSIDQEKAYEEAVDELLQSPSFGEHMSIAWLDVARYADSYGYQSDKLNTQWPYRDWVVRAFNENLPYDDFLTWQIAGDLLENPTREQQLATAFNRIHRLNNEGGAVFEEWRIENVADRVHTFSTAVMGLTLECARCHDHKYDPISAREFYSLSAFFNSIDESGVYDRTEKVPCPSLLLPTEKQSAELAAARVELTKQEERYADEVDQAKERFQLVTPQTVVPNSIPDLRLALSFDRKFNNSIKDLYHPSESDRAWAAMVDLVEVNDSDIPRLDASIADDDKALTAKATQDHQVDSSPTRKALKLDGERGVTTHGIEPLDRWMPFSIVVTLKDTERSTERSLIVHHTRGTDCGYNGYDLTIQDGHLESRLARVWPGNAISVKTVNPIPADQWHQVCATYDGSSTAAGLKLYLDGQELETITLRDAVKKSANVKVDHGGEFVIGQRFRARGFTGGLIDDVRLYDRDLTALELRVLATGEPQSADAATYVSAFDEKAREAFAKLRQSRHAFVMAEEVIQEVPIMREMQQPRETHLLARGEYNAETNESTRVQREVLGALPIPFPEDAPQDRLGLARWVTHPHHPLTARVAVNRLWGNFFAEPLVRTPENFGLQGDLPTHPKLLDWLARDFVDHGWDMQRLCRNIVLSSTYRQDSRCTQEQYDADPTNQLLARGPSYRLAAEQIRDLALAAAGLLNPEMGGPPVSPYQPGEDLWRESNGMSPPYQQSVGKSLYRRSLYSVWKRTSPLPNMMVFDATSREVCTVKRSRTNTPLQALVLLNDEQFIEAARVLASTVLDQASLSDRIDDAFLQLAGRHPDATEMEQLTTLYEREQKFFDENPDAAKAFLSIGERDLPKNVSLKDLAATTSLCQVILNLDATIWKR
ncbi:DUF1553 domain-containing protein [Rhodopirellula sp. JC740]|uniref:DUF1553 domain-containing protein n=1 Tax=Rhodopirellula halodulae TaxID=2894198 RepID=A0ABS8NDT5_9BACT|nr:DUF1553 domain-containing protein [Rhodopirellula sp. JC740]MCC9641719.1 DUF1553 domain-containing protein [Rhodopirellula sp. JC740]